MVWRRPNGAAMGDSPCRTAEWGFAPIAMGGCNGELAKAAYIARKTCAMMSVFGFRPLAGVASGARRIAIRVSVQAARTRLLALGSDRLDGLRQQGPKPLLRRDRWPTDPRIHPAAFATRRNHTTAAKTRILLHPFLFLIAACPHEYPGQHHAHQPDNRCRGAADEELQNAFRKTEREYVKPMQHKNSCHHPTIDTHEEKCSLCVRLDQSIQDLDRLDALPGSFKFLGDIFLFGTYLSQGIPVIFNADQSATRTRPYDIRCVVNVAGLYRPAIGLLDPQVPTR